MLMPSAAVGATQTRQWCMISPLWPAMMGQLPFFTSLNDPDSTSEPIGSPKQPILKCSTSTSVAQSTFPAETEDKRFVVTKRRTTALLLALVQSLRFDLSHWDIKMVSKSSTVIAQRLAVRAMPRECPRLSISRVARMPALMMSSSTKKIV